MAQSGANDNPAEHMIEGEAAGNGKTRIDRVMFATVATVIVAICAPLGLMPEASTVFVTKIYGEITQHFGIFYQGCTLAVIVFLAWLALGPYGAIRLGGEHSRSDYSTFSWAAMLFCAGTGASLMAWAGVEWINYYNNPPYGAVPRSPEAIQWATAYGPFHWGVTAWCIYALPTIAIAYPFYQQKVPHLCASTSCHAILGPRGNRGLAGRAIDTVAMLALLGGTGTSLSMIVPMIATITAELFGVPDSFTLKMGVIAVCVGLFSLSVYLGLEKGIKPLSDFNVASALLLLGYILVIGPTVFILKMSMDTIGFMASNFIRMMTWTDPIRNTGFVEAWTIFYWAWWIAYAPVIGIFVTRISRGRTIRQVILSMILFGSLGCWIFYFVQGNYALFLELKQLLPVSKILAEQGMNVATAKVLLSLPFGPVALAIFALVAMISVATTYDSAAYTLASTATAELKANTNPARWHRVFWALASGVLPLTMMFLGGMDIIRLGVLVASFPILFIGIAMAISLRRSLRESAPGQPTS